MPGAARVGDKTKGSFNSDHCHHIVYEYDSEGHVIGSHKEHTSGEVNGTIKSNGGTVYINGKEVATEGSTVSESDIEDTGNGIVGPCSSEVYVNGKKIALKGDKVQSHTGQPAQITEGSDDVIIGG